MANSDRREALRGAEEETFDLLAEVLTSGQWAELLKAPLERAARQGNRGLAQKLVRAGAEIGDALHGAIRGGHGDVVSDLLENGASIAAKNASRCGWTPLHVAAREGQTEMVQLLLVKGADKDPMDNNDNTPLYLAMLNRHAAAARALMAAGADVTPRCGPCKRSVVHVAAKRGHVDVLRAAIERGADVDAADIDRWTPLHWAAVEGGLEAMHVLLEAEADIEARDRGGGTPLHNAADEVNLEAVLALLKHGADVNAQNKLQQTPLHLVACNSILGGAAAEMVYSLLRSGADETILSGEGEAAVDIVEEYASEDDQFAKIVQHVRELLVNAPADRAWRRRGHLTLCRAHPDRVQQAHESSSARADVARTSGSSAELARTEANSCTGTAGGYTVGGRGGGDWAGVVARVLGLQEEGIFRAIVGYL